MKHILKQIAFKFASSKSGGWMIWFILRYFPFLIPFKKLYQDQNLIAIPHPLPSYATHILLLPRVYMPDFLELDIQSETGNNYVQSVQKALNVLLADLKQTNMQLVINGGNFQDVKLLHMHLIENNLDIPQLKLHQADNSAAGLSDLFLQAKSSIQNNKYSAFRLIFSFQKIQIHLHLRITM